MLSRPLSLLSLLSLPTKLAVAAASEVPSVAGAAAVSGEAVPAECAGWKNETVLCGGIRPEYDTYVRLT